MKGENKMKCAITKEQAEKVTEIICRDAICATATEAIETYKDIEIEELVPLFMAASITERTMQVLTDVFETLGITDVITE